MLPSTDCPADDVNEQVAELDAAVVRREIDRGGQWLMAGQKRARPKVK